MASGLQNELMENKKIEMSISVGGRLAHKLYYKYQAHVNGCLLHSSLYYSYEDFLSKFEQQKKKWNRLMDHNEPLDGFDFLLSILQTN